jgi:predicted PhzF superfamily epimerase YddE/YHI9
MPESSDLRYFVVDAFTAERFRGNPAAVVPLATWLPDELMQSIAAELALSETAFFAPEGGGLRLRWFTPEVEVDLCGHATLATSFVLMTQLEPARTGVAYQSRSGELRVARDGERFTLDFPSWPAKPEPDAAIRDAVAAALGKRPRELWRARDLFAVYDSPDDVRRLAPDFARMKQISLAGAGPARNESGAPEASGGIVHAICATAPADGAKRPAPGVADFVSRFFAPAQGIDEDPVTGSAHCTLTPMWAERLGRSTLTGHQVSKRGGVIECRLAGDRVALGGHAVLVATGALHL